MTTVWVFYVSAVNIKIGKKRNHFFLQILDIYHIPVFINYSYT